MKVLNIEEIGRWNAISQKTMARIAKAKYAQCPEAMAVLRMHNCGIGLEEAKGL